MIPSPDTAFPAAHSALWIRLTAGRVFRLTLLTVVACSALAPGRQPVIQTQPATSPQTVTPRLSRPVVSGRQIAEVLSEPGSWSGAGVTLGQHLTQLSQRTGITILRDRRLDPDQIVTIETSDAPRAEVLRQLAESIDRGGWCFTDEFVYFGTVESAGRLPVLLAASRQLMADLRREAAAAQKERPSDNAVRALASVRPVHWQAPAEPRQIVAAAAQAVGLSIRNPEQIPHDLWDSADWPDLTFCELATVILNQFGLMLAADGPMQVAIVPIDDQQVVRHSYELSRDRREEMVAAFRRQMPNLAVTVRGLTMQVSASVQDHAVVNQHLLRSRFAGATGEPSESLKTRLFTLRAERTTVGQLVEYFRKNNVRIEIPDEASPDVRATLSSAADVTGLQEKLPGAQFFAQVFGAYFRNVDVRDDRVVLSGK